MSNAKARKILIPILNRAHYGRLRSVLNAVQNHPQLELQLLVGTPAAYDYFWLNLKHSQPYSWHKSLPWYLRARLLSLFKPGAVLTDDFLARTILSDGYKINARVPLFFDGGLPETMAKSVGFGFISLVDELKRLQPDLVFVNADRFEMMTVALAAVCLNIPIAHNEAGDVSGTIDESIRHAITKLAHIHFAVTEASRERVLQMGENPDYVFAVGSPAIDVIKNLDITPDKNLLANFDITKPYLLALVHPVATENEETNYLMASNLIKVLEEVDVPTVFLGSNLDAMSAAVGKAIRSLREQRTLNALYLAKHLPPDVFYKVLANATCAVGNSSSFIREGAYFGTPAVLIGTRQQNREQGKNVITVWGNQEEIKAAIAKQLKHGRYQSEKIFGGGTAGSKIADILANARLKIQKQFYDKKT